MIRALRLPLPLLLLAAVLQLGSSASAEEVRREHIGLALLGNLEVPAGKRIEGAPVALIVHGSLAHHGMEIVTELQSRLKAQGVTSLAITLSLGLDARRGMLDCTVEHDHRASDAVEEISAWIDWLKERKAASVHLVGHSRGAQQVAQYAAGEPDDAMGRIVLVAPPTDTPAEAAARYREAYGADLDQVLAGATKLVQDGEEDTILDLPGFLSCKPARVTAAAAIDYYDPERKRAASGLLASIKQPVLVVAGSADHVSPEVAARVAAAKPGPHVTIETIDGADHFFRDLFADDLAEKVAGFLK